MAVPETRIPAHARLARALAEARRSTEQLLAPLDQRDLTRPFSPLQSPIVWDIGHIAHYEELWIVRNAAGGEPTDPRFDDVYDAFAHPRSERPTLELLAPDAARRYAVAVRERALAALPRLGAGDDPRLETDGFVVGLVVQHELQHGETICQTIQAADGVAYAFADEPAFDETATNGEVIVPGGPFILGADDQPWAYDNERRAHVVDVPPFAIDRKAVTNGAFMAFVDAGCYRDRSCWSAEGWRWIERKGAAAPLYWRRTPDGFERRRFGRTEWVPRDEPVQHVSWFEADAYARSVGKRLPTETEWEKAATWTRDGWKQRLDPASANVGRRRFGPAPAGAYGDAPGPNGCLAMLGDVWEWTASPFGAYPGFEAFPYPEYSEVFFGDTYRVLRGGSWATHPLVARATFRNWDLPGRRQIFSGFRCARDI